MYRVPGSDCTIKIEKNLLDGQVDTVYYNENGHSLATLQRFLPEGFAFKHDKSLPTDCARLEANRGPSAIVTSEVTDRLIFDCYEHRVRD